MSSIDNEKYTKMFTILKQSKLNKKCIKCGTKDNLTYQKITTKEIYCPDCAIDEILTNKI